MSANEWARRPIGLVLRAVLAIAGTAAGLILVAIGNFGATYKNDTPVWDFEATAFVVLGVFMIAGVILAAIRPNRRTFAFLALVMVSVPIADWVG